MQNKDVISSVFPLEEIRTRIKNVQILLGDLKSMIASLRPQRKDLRWFGRGYYQPQLELIYKGGEDSLNHAATMIGYFDGFQSRGMFQERVSEALSMPKKKDIFSLLDYLNDIFTQCSEVFDELLGRDSLSMAVNGPSKPGPIKSLHVCYAHLKSLQMRLCALLIALTRGVFKERAERFFEELPS